MKIISTILLVLFMFFSCKRKTNKKVFFKQKLVDTNEKTLLKNNKNYFYAFTSQITDSLLIRLKMRSNEEGLSIYNLNNNKKLDIILTTEQIRSLNKLRGFHYLNKDTIFLIGRSKILIINKNGNTIYNAFYNHPKNNEYFPVSCSNRTKPFLYKKRIYFNKIIDKIPSNSFYSENTLVSFNFEKEDKYKIVKNSSYPKSYYDRCWFTADLNLSYAKKDSTLIFSFPANDSLFVYSLNKNKRITKISGKSIHKAKEITPANCDNIWDSKSYHKHIYTNTMYRDIIYDKYKNIFYRMVTHPKKSVNKKKRFNSLNLPFSIQVFDSEFNLITESEILNLKPNYIMFDYFVNKEGLWISNNNPENPIYNESQLTFSLFKLQKSYEN